MERQILGEPRIDVHIEVRYTRVEDPMNTPGGCHTIFDRDNMHIEDAKELLAFVITHLEALRKDVK